ncbi:hypothetical protein NQZ68_017859 [Dissostichus eleginoides]|nr:hypothetical protein NQZ68_017859 [Dissostichus eleginoides]
MAAAVSSRSRGAAGGLFFLFTLLGLVCTAASLMDENKLARRDTASEFNNGFMSLLDPTIAFMRKAAEGSPEYSAVTEEYLKSTKGFMEKFKSLMDGDNVKLDAKISKWEQDLRKKKIFVQAQEEQHAELNKFQQHNEYFYQQYGRQILRLYANQRDPPQSVDEANASGMRVSFQNFIQYLLDPLTERKEPFEPQWRQMHRQCQTCLTKHTGRGHRKESITHFEVRHQIIPFIRHRYRRSPFTHITAAMAAAVSSRSRGSAGGLFFLFTLLGLVCTAASLDENKLKHFKELLQDEEQDLDTAKARRDTASEFNNGFMSLLDPTIAFMRKAAEGSPEYSAVTEEYLKSTKGFMEKFKSLMDGDNVKLDAKISKWEQDLRKKKIFVQAQEEQHAELHTGRGHRKESITHFEVRHQIIPFIRHRYRRSPFTHITAMAAAVSSRSRGAAGGLFFLFTLLGLVCTAASLMDENKLKNLKEKLQKAEQDLDKLKARRDTASEFINGFMSLLDPTIAFMRKAAEGSPEFSALSEEYLKSTKGFMENVKSLMDGDNVKLDAEILKLEQDLRASKKIVQSLEEYHAEL